VQDNIDAGEIMGFSVLGNALDGFVRHRLTHPLGHLTPTLICHFIDIAVSAGQIAAAMHFQDKLPERNRELSRRADHRYVKVEQRPRRRVVGRLNRCHSNQAAKASGSTWIP
jgi:hypothetical protein